ncbi:MAG: RluA family pseudouridine synthase [Candidatus Omnitrophota bacterium]|nr:MAG: RluA family pseudouridine synthase [Candidatus Omnitrophota bacterium]
MLLNRYYAQSFLEMKKAFEIVFNDEYVIVLNKIAKILVQPSPKKEKYTLTTLLEEQISQSVYPCHRLDRQTTGLIAYAKTSQIQREIMEQFRKGQVKKEYIAFVKGKVKSKTHILEDYIRDREAKRFGERAKSAKTFCRALKVFNDFSVVELRPLTGRTNQLRIQLAKRGHPILGERKYAFGRDFKVKFRRLALHAYFLSFIHPVSGERLRLEIDLPEDMKAFLQAHWGVKY